MNQKNLRFKQIHLYSFRHFCVCMLYFQIKEILLVNDKRGHRPIENSMKDTHFANWETLISGGQMSTNNDIGSQLIEEGFKFVRFDDRLQCSIYRRGDEQCWKLSGLIAEPTILNHFARSSNLNWPYRMPAFN
jgi:hypothetical protein